MAAPSTAPTGRRSSPLDRRHIERRELTSRYLLPAVERLLDRETYPSLTVDQMTAEAEISRSTFYNYFEDKSDLLRTLTGDVMAAITEAARVWWMLSAHVTKDELQVALQHLFEIHAPHAVLLRAVSETISHDERVRTEFMDYMRNGAKGVQDYIRAGQKAGVLRADLDPNIAGDWLTWMFERGLSQLSFHNADADPERMLIAAVDVLWKALH